MTTLSESEGQSGKGLATPFIIYVVVMFVAHFVLLILIITLSVKRCIAFYRTVRRYKLDCKDLEYSAREMREKVKFEERYASIVNDPEIFGSTIDSPTVSVSPETSEEETTLTMLTQTSLIK